MHKQIDLFTGELKDTRTRRQRKAARSQAAPQQLGMFGQRELAQFGVRARPKIDISPKTRLELLLADARSEEEKQREIEERHVGRLIE